MNQSVSIDRRQLLVQALAGAGVASLLSGASVAAPAAPVSGADATPPTGDIHDFDFFVGTWNGANRRLKKRFAGSQEWDEFPGTLTCGSHLGGVVNLDYDVVFPTKGWSGMTVRAFNLQKRQWYIYWINSRTGELFPPVVGGFAGGDRGLFYGDDTDDGRPVKVQFLWTRLDHDHARWQQAFSRDGKNWETNWICDHTRAKG